MEKVEKKEEGNPPKSPVLTREKLSVTDPRSGFTVDVAFRVSDHGENSYKRLESVEKIVKKVSGDIALMDLAALRVAIRQSNVSINLSIIDPFPTERDLDRICPTEQHRFAEEVMRSMLQRSNDVPLAGVTVESVRVRFSTAETNISGSKIQVEVLR